MMVSLNQMRSSVARSVYSHFEAGRCTHFAHLPVQARTVVVRTLAMMAIWTALTPCDVPYSKGFHEMARFLLSGI
jgi:hypothetical protein